MFEDNEIRHIVLDLEASDWQILNDNPLLEEYVPGSVTYEGETYDQVGIRYKGAFASLARCFTDGERNDLCTKLNLKLKFNEYVPGQRFHTMKRVNLHAMDGDPSFMRETLSYEAFRNHGVFAPRTSYVSLEVNGEFLGLFLAVEQIDGRFTRNRFEDGGKGNLYKEVWPNEYSETPYLNALKTNEDENPSTDKMLRFAESIRDGGQAGFKSTMEEWMDIEHWITYFAIERLVGQWDGIFAWYCYSGCLLYTSPSPRDATLSRMPSSA